MGKREMHLYCYSQRSECVTVRNLNVILPQIQKQIGFIQHVEVTLRTLLILNLFHTFVILAWLLDKLEVHGLSVVVVFPEE
jgi:hypothetical protein